MDPPDAIHTVTEDILYGVCCRNRRTRRGDVMTSLGEGTAASFAVPFTIER
jgi:hypothetical protein